MLEQIVNLAVTHAALAPPLPDRCEDLLERLRASLICAIQVGRDNLMGIGRRILSARGQALRAFALHRE